MAETSTDFELFDLTPMLGRDAQSSRQVTIAGKQTSRRVVVTFLVGLITSFLPLAIGLSMGQKTVSFAVMGVWLVVIVAFFNMRQSGGLRLRHSEHFFSSRGITFGSGATNMVRFTNNVPLLSFKPVDLAEGRPGLLVPGARPNHDRPQLALDLDAPMGPGGRFGDFDALVATTLPDRKKAVVRPQRLRPAPEVAIDTSRARGLSIGGAV